VVGVAEEYKAKSIQRKLSNLGDELEEWFLGV
jgi:hypothetical protein